MFFVWPFRSIGVSQMPPGALDVSGFLPFASRQATTQALQPMQSVVS